MTLLGPQVGTINGQSVQLKWSDLASGHRQMPHIKDICLERSKSPGQIEWYSPFLGRAWKSAHDPGKDHTSMTDLMRRASGKAHLSSPGLGSGLRKDF